MSSVGIAEAKRDFADLLGAVRHRGARFVIERRGTPVAALVPLDDLARLERTPDEDGRPSGFLALVGAFDDAPELPDLLDEAVRDRPAQRPRPVPDLGDPGGAVAVDHDGGGDGDAVDERRTPTPTASP